MEKFNMKFRKSLAQILLILALVLSALSFAEDGGVLGLDGSENDIKTNSYLFYDHDGKLLNKQVIKAGDSLEKPNIPGTLKNKTFKHWEDEGGNAFDGFGKIDNIEEDNKTIKLYPKYSLGIKLYHIDDLGNVFRTHYVEDGEEIDISPSDTNFRSMAEELRDSKSLTGWTNIENGNESLNGKWRLQFESDRPCLVKGGKKLYIDEGMLKLHPILNEGYWVSFNSKGGTPFIPQFISKTAENKKITPPTKVYKQGYVFDGWYSDEALTSKFDENSDITKSQTLYAAWKEADDTRYTVKYYIEYQKDTSVSDINDQNAWDYRFLGSEIRTGKTGAKAEFDDKFIFKSPYHSDKNGYELNAEKTKEVTIAPDGSSVYNVYYKCKLFKTTFSGRHKDSNTTVFPAGAAAHYEKSWTLKFKQDMAFIYDVLNQDGVVDFMNNNKISFYSTDGANNQITVDSIKTSKAPAKDYYYAMLKPGPANSYYNYYFETLNGKAPDGKPVVNNVSRRGSGDTRTYYRFLADKFNSYGNGALAFRARSEYPGFTVRPDLSDGHYRIYNNGTVVIWFRYHASWTSVNQLVDENGNGVNYWGENQPLNVYFSRNSYKLNFETNGAPAPEIGGQPLQNNAASVPYEEDLNKFIPSNYEKNVTKYVDKNGQEFTFAGWYADPGFKKEFDFSSTMPYWDLHAYAKWEAKLLRVDFKLDESTVYKTIDSVPYGSTVEEPKDIPQREGYVFLGWSLKGKPFNFSSAIKENTTLIANWRSLRLYNASYDLNGAEGKIEDKNKYYTGAGVIMPSVENIVPPKGRLFAGWKLEGSDEIYYPNSVVPMKEGGIRLIAQWVQKEKLTRLTYDFNFDEFGIAAAGETKKTVEGLMNNSRLELADFSALASLPAGYDFTGWFLDKACTKGPYKRVLVDSRNPDNNIVYAGWKARPQPSYNTVKLPLKAFKKLVNGRLLDGQFSFQLYRGDRLIETKTNDESGLISFTPRSFSRTGTFVYTIKELGGENSKISYDKSVYTLTVKSEDVGGELRLSTSLQKDGKEHSGNIEFVNRASVPKTGDSFSPVYIVIALAAALVLGASLIIGKKKINKR